MKTFIFSLPKSWDGVVEYFTEIYNDREKKSKLFSFDVYKTSQCWLAHSIYLKTGSVCNSSAEIILPFDIEIMIYHDCHSLIDEDVRLKEFDYYLNFIDLTQYNLSFYIDVKVFHNTLVLTKL